MTKKTSKKANKSTGGRSVHDAKEGTHDQAQTSDSSSERETNSEKEDTKGKKPQQPPGQEEDIG